MAKNDHMDYPDSELEEVRKRLDHLTLSNPVRARRLARNLTTTVLAILDHAPPVPVKPRRGRKKRS